MSRDSHSLRLGKGSSVEPCNAFHMPWEAEMSWPELRNLGEDLRFCRVRV